MIRAGVRADSKIGGGNFECVSISRIETLPKCIDGVLNRIRHLVTLLPVGLAAPGPSVPYETVPSGDAFPGTSCLPTISLALRDKSPYGPWAAAAPLR